MVGAVLLLQGPVTAFAVLLGIGGVAKIRRPASTVRAARALGISAGSATIRLLAAGEVAIGCFVILSGNSLASLLLALSYLGFTGVVILAKAKVGSLSSCGCFGAPDTPPTATHLVVTVAASAVALLSVVRPAGPLLTALRDQPLAGIPFLFLTGCCVWFAYAALAILPRTSALVRSR